MKNLLMKHVLLSVCLLATGLPAYAVPITIDSTDVFRETRYDPPSGFATGDNFLVDATVSDSTGTTMTVTNTSNLSEIFNLSLSGSSYFAFVPYSSARANGDWIFNAVNGVDMASETLGAYGTGPGTGEMPGVENLTVSGSLLAPTLMWDLPVDLPSANDGNVDRLRVRVQNSFGSQIFDSRSDLNQSIGLDVTSYIIPEGYITESGTYYAQVLIEGFDPVFVRSRTFASGFTIEEVPEPSIIALFAAGLFGLRFARRKVRS